MTDRIALESRARVLDEAVPYVHRTRTVQIVHTPTQEFHISEPYSVSALRANLYRLLDRVLETGRPVEVERRGERLQIVRSEKRSRLSLVRPVPGYLTGDVESLLGLDWSDEWRA